MPLARGHRSRFSKWPSLVCSAWSRHGNYPKGARIRRHVAVDHDEVGGNLARFVYPDLGRAGLGNELFALSRAFDRSITAHATLLPPRWLQLRVGPIIRGERDTRQYWRLFRRPQLRMVVLRFALTRLHLHRLPLLRRYAELETVAGMASFFAELRQAPGNYLQFLADQARPTRFRKTEHGVYVAVHVRLGDFAHPSSDTGIPDENNQRVALGWYSHHIRSLAVLGAVDVVIASDGSSDELCEILSLPGVRRSAGRNALEDLLVLAGASGIIGSRSTFTAWGAFLAESPLLVPPGCNAYRPHQNVWESGFEDSHAWLEAVASRSRTSDLGAP